MPGVRVVDGVRFVRGGTPKPSPVFRRAFEWTGHGRNDRFSARADVYPDGGGWTVCVTGSDGADWHRGHRTFLEACRDGVVGINYILDGSPEA
jgi:hypothetical protein